MGLDLSSVSLLIVARLSGSVRATSLIRDTVERHRFKVDLFFSQLIFLPQDNTITRAIRCASNPRPCLDTEQIERTLRFQVYYSPFNKRQTADGIGEVKSVAL